MSYAAGIGTALVAGGVAVWSFINRHYLNNQLAEKDSKIKILNDSISNLKNSLTLSNNNITNLENQLANQNSTINSLKKDKFDLNSALNNYKKLNESQVKQIQDLFNDLTLCDSNYENISNYYSQSQFDLNQCQSNFNQCQALNENLNNNINIFNNAINYIKFINGGYFNYFEDSKKIAVLDSKLKHKNDELEKCSKDVASKTKENQKLSAKLKYSDFLYLRALNIFYKTFVEKRNETTNKNVQDIWDYVYKELSLCNQPWYCRWFGLRCNPCESSL